MTAPPNLVLYFAPGGSSMAVHIALHEIGVPFDGRPMSFHKQDMRSAAFRAVNPAGMVPTMLVDGEVLTEVAACLFYLARRFPESGLLPVNDIAAQAQAISWMSFIASTLHPARQRGVERVMQVWQLPEHRMRGRDWLTGRFTVADIHLFRLWWRIVGSMKPERAAFPRLFDHYDRMMARPSVQRTIAVESAIGYELPA